MKLKKDCFAGENMVGRVFGRRTVIGFAGVDASRQSFWVCQCSCKDRTVSVHRKGSLTSGNANSCGCLHKEIISKMSRTHGHTVGGKTVIYAIWCSMMARCRDGNSPGWKNYGGRGIKVCKRWRKFENFLADMGGTFQPGLMIERINNDGDYTPSNCKWATRTEQNNNTRRCRVIEFNGMKKNVTQWAAHLGIPAPTLFTRIYTGKSIKEVLAT
jgi:hypothetical protein